MNTDTEDTAEFIDPGADEIIEGEGEPEAAATAAEDKDAGKDKGKGKSDDADIRSELNSLRARLNESEQATRYWHEQAKGAGPARVAAAEVDDKPLSVDLVDAISSGDKGKIRAALGELGFVDRGTMDRHIAAARQQGMTESQLLSQYPDLARNDSDFFKATQRHFAELVADGMDASSLITTKAAAKLAKADMAGEAGRGDRIRRQAGDRGARPSSRGRDGASDELTNQQLSIVQRFAAAGAPVTAEGYKKRAAEIGVNMGGVGGVRSRKAA